MADTSRDFYLDACEADHREGTCGPDCPICEVESLEAHADEGDEA